jgi:flavodoxin
MNALIIYDSQYGNTEKVARAIAEGMQQAGGEQMTLTVLRVHGVTPEHFKGLGLLVMGSPTQKFNPTGSITFFLRNIPWGELKGVAVTGFDTRLTPEEINRTKVLAFFVKFFGYAGKTIALQLVSKGGKLVLPAEGFLVQGMEGPLVDGELERAKTWGKEIVAEMKKM